MSPDLIVVGAGAAGCALVCSLLTPARADDGERHRHKEDIPRVLLLERGDERNTTAVEAAVAVEAAAAVGACASTTWATAAAEGPWRSS